MTQRHASVWFLVSVLMHVPACATGQDPVQAGTSPAAQPVAAAVPAQARELPPGARDIPAFAREFDTFGAYWYQGLAELSRYELVQARYGDQHAGDVALIYVTEDFLADVQVKHEFGDNTNAVPVLKLNAHRRFDTGVYPYSVYTSVFLPVREPYTPALKVTSSIQEWCGATWQQFNRRGDVWETTLHSYFQAEGDQRGTVGGLLEDELWVRVRQGPDALPTGTHNVVPASHHVRMVHIATEPVPAELALSEVPRSPFSDEPALRYVIAYEGISRRVEIFIEPAFPHRIVAWTEVVGEGEENVTTAVLRRSLLLDYWNHNGADDGVYRDALRLD